MRIGETRALRLAFLVTPFSTSFFLLKSGKTSCDANSSLLSLLVSSRTCPARGSRVVASPVSAIDADEKTRSGTASCAGARKIVDRRACARVRRGASCTSTTRDGSRSVSNSLQHTIATRFTQLLIARTRGEDRRTSPLSTPLAADRLFFAWGRHFLAHIRQSRNTRLIITFARLQLAPRLTRHKSACKMNTPHGQKQTRSSTTQRARSSQPGTATHRVQSLRITNARALREGMKAGKEEANLFNVGSP